MLQKSFFYSGLLALVLLLASCKDHTNKNNTNAPLTQLDSAKTPYSAIQRLISGNHRFANDKSEFQHTKSAYLDSISGKQNPYACIVGCSDARVPIEYIFDEGVGDLYVVRTAGNTVADTGTLGSIEYAAEKLKVKAIVVLGHEDCQTIQSAFEIMKSPRKKTKLTENLEVDSCPNWTSLINRTADTLKKSRNTISTIHQATLYNIQAQVDLIKQNPVISKKIAEGDLVVVGAIYSINTRKVKFWSK